MEEPRQSVILNNDCKSVLSFGVKQCLESQILLAAEEYCQVLLAGVNIPAFGKQLLKEHYGTKSYLWNLGLLRRLY